MHFSIGASTLNFSFWYGKVEEKKIVRTYACGVSIKRTLTGKLALCSQNFDWAHPVQEKAQKPLKFGHLKKWAIFGGFWTFS